MHMNEQCGARAVAPRYRAAHVDPETEARRLVSAYSNLILRLSFTYLKSTHDAQDICQSVLMKLIERQEAFQDLEHEKAWVVRTTANACKDALRNAYRRTSTPLEAADACHAPEEPEGSAVLDAVMELDEKYREAIYLHYYEGLFHCRNCRYNEPHRVCGGGASEPRPHEIAHSAWREGRRARFRSERKHSRRRQPHDRKKAHTTCA